MFDIKFSQFFDRAGVIKHVKDGTRSVLSKAGAFIRTRAKSSIRTRKRTARPGEPPSSHTARLKQLIFFAYDRAENSVVVGPLLFRRRDPTVPELLEVGGVAKHWRNNKPATYHKFPYMQPALEKEKPNFPNLFTDCVK